MKKLFPLIMLLMTSPAYADGLHHKLSSSVQVTVNAAATNVVRMGNTYTVSGSGVEVTDGTTAGNLGGLGAATNGVNALTTTTASLYGDGDEGLAFSFSEYHFAGDGTTDAPDVGAVSAFSNQTSTAAGALGDGEGTITTGGTIGLTGGDPGSSIVGQFVSEITIR